MYLLRLVKNLIPNLFRWGLISRWLIALCIWASATQASYPVLIAWPLWGPVTAGVIGLCLFVLLVRLAERFSPGKPVWILIRPFLHVGDFAALGYCLCGVILYLNGILTTAPPQKAFAEVLSAKEEPFGFGRWIPAGRLELAVEGSEAIPRFLSVDSKTLHRIVEGQGVSIVTYDGGLGLSWVDMIMPDSEYTWAALTAKGIDDTVLNSRNIRKDLSEQKFRKAYPKAQRYLAQEPDDVVMAAELADLALRAGERTLAGQLFEQRIAKYHNYRLYISYGYFLTSNGDQKGIDYFKAAVGMDPEFPEAYYMMGHAYNNLGYKDESRVVFNKLVELQPEYAYLLHQ